MLRHQYVTCASIALQLVSGSSRPPEYTMQGGQQTGVGQRTRQGWTMRCGGRQQLSHSMS
jgi:hypothetical protein